MIPFNSLASLQSLPLHFITNIYYLNLLSSLQISLLSNHIYIFNSNQPLKKFLIRNNNNLYLYIRVRHILRPVEVLKLLMSQQCPSTRFKALNMQMQGC